MGKAGEVLHLHSRKQGPPTRTGVRVQEGRVGELLSTQERVQVLEELRPTQIGVRVLEELRLSSPERLA